MPSKKFSPGKQSYHSGLYFLLILLQVLAGKPANNFGSGSFRLQHGLVSFVSLGFTVVPGVIGWGKGRLGKSKDTGLTGNNILWRQQVAREQSVDDIDGGLV